MRIITDDADVEAGTHIVLATQQRSSTQSSRTKTVLSRKAHLFDVAQASGSVAVCGRGSDFELVALEPGDAVCQLCVKYDPFRSRPDDEAWPMGSLS